MTYSFVTSIRFSFFVWPVALCFSACGGSTSQDGDAAGSGANPGVGGSGSGGNGAGGVNQDGNNVKGYGDGTVVYENGSFAGCTDPEEFIPGVDTGYYSCMEPVIWREEIIECPNRLPRDNVVEFPEYVTNNLGGAPGSTDFEIVADECSSNADCDEKSRCVARQVNASGECVGPIEPERYQWARQCEPGCTVDSDCTEGQICLCDTEIGRCAPQAYVHGCASDADCDDGYHCLMNLYAAFGCQLPGDECHSSVGCDANEMCTYSDEEDARLCVDYDDGGC